MARTYLLGTGKRKEEDSILLEFCCTLTLLEGISNWINNCLIPISQLDLSAQTEEDASYGKERNTEWEGERVKDMERHRYMRRKGAQGTVF